MRTPLPLLFCLLCSLSVFAQSGPTPREYIYVQTDRTLYEAGDPVLFQAYLTGPQGNPDSALSDVVTVQLLDPGGTVIQTVNAFRGPHGLDGYLQLNAQLKGGRYRLRAYTNYLGNFGEQAHFTKNIYLQEVINPDLLLQLEPERESFAPGTTVAYTLTARNRSDSILVGAEVSAGLIVDGEALPPVLFSTDATGTADLRLSLPADLASENVLISATVGNDGEAESVFRPVRVSLGFVDFRLYPEGGERAAGPQKIAFRASDRLGKPLDVSGDIYLNGIPTLPLRSSHNGYGHFQLPDVGLAEVTIRLHDFPDTVFQLSPPSFTAIAASTELTDTSLLLRINQEDLPLLNLELSRDGTHYVREPLTNKVVDIPLKRYPPGVYQLRLIDPNGLVRWERMIFHRPKSVQITGLKQKETGKGHEFQLVGEDGRLVQGDFSVAVVNDGPYVRQNDKQPHLVTQLLLQSRLTGTLYEPNDYFDPEQPAAMAALDDVLLCHGWRVYEAPEQQAFHPLHTGLNGSIRRGYADALRRSLTFNGQKLKPNKDKRIIHRVRHFATATLKPRSNNDYRYRPQNTPWEKEQTVSLVARVLPTTGSIYTPPKEAVQRRRAKKPKAKIDKTLKVEKVNQAVGKAKPPAQPATRPSKPRNNVRLPVPPSDTELGIVSEASAQLSEVVVVGYGSTHKSNASGSSVRVDYTSDRNNYSIQQQEVAPENRPARFSPMQGAVRLQKKQAFAYRLRFGTQRPQDQTAPLLYWNGRLDQENDHFQLPHDAKKRSATYRIVLEGITEDNQPVHLEETFGITAPWSFNARLPSHALVGDTLLLTATLRNNGSKARVFSDSLRLSYAFTRLTPTEKDITVAPNSARTLERRIVVNQATQRTKLAWTALPKGQAKGIEQHGELTSRPRLFTHSAFATSAGSQEISIDLDPEEHVGPVTAQLRLYGNAVDKILDEYAGMLREPHGCFEQVTSTAYPNALIVGLLRDQPRLKDEITLRNARKYLASGYRQLSRYQQPNGGYGLWQNAPAKPRYTAMALIQFADLARVWDGVQKADLVRAQNYLSKYLKAQGFQSGPAQLYQLLALAKHGEPGLEQLIERHAKAVARHPKEHYYALLLTQVFAATGQQEQARTQVRALVPAVLGKSLNNRSESAGIGSAYGRFTEVEMLCYFIESYLATEGYDNTVEEAFASATQLMGKSRYQPTQAKVRYLSALSALVKYRPAPENGYLDVFLNGSLLDTVQYNTGVGRVVNLDFTGILVDGPNELRLRFATAESYPALRFLAEWKRELPPITEEPPLTLRWSGPVSAERNATLAYGLELVNETQEAVRNPMVQLGLPGNADLLLKDLDGLIERGIVDFYELEGAYLNLYLEELAAGEIRQIPLTMTARLAGDYLAPAATVYPYYQPHKRSWRKGMRLRVK